MFKPADDDFAARVDAGFAMQGIMGLLGARLERVAPGEVHIALPFREQLSQHHGYYHGGVTSTIADSACGFSAFSLVPVDSTVLTIEYKLNFLAPAHGELIVARGRVIKPGRTITVAQADVYVIANGEEKICATMVETVMTIPKKPEQ